MPGRFWLVLLASIGITVAVVLAVVLTRSDSVTAPLGHDAAATLPVTDAAGAPAPQVAGLPLHLDGVPLPGLESRP